MVAEKKLRGRPKKTEEMASTPSEVDLAKRAASLKPKAILQIALEVTDESSVPIRTYYINPSVTYKVSISEKELIEGNLTPQDYVSQNIISLIANKFSNLNDDFGIFETQMGSVGSVLAGEGVSSIPAKTAPKISPPPKLPDSSPPSPKKEEKRERVKLPPGGVQHSHDKKPETEG